MQLHEQITSSDLPISRMFLHANMVGINKFFPDGIEAHRVSIHYKLRIVFA